LTTLVDVLAINAVSLAMALRVLLYYERSTTNDMRRCRCCAVVLFAFCGQQAFRRRQGCRHLQQRMRGGLACARACGGQTMT